jgi:hypothetical protein
VFIGAAKVEGKTLGVYVVVAKAGVMGLRTTEGAVIRVGADKKGVDMGAGIDVE